MNYQRWPIVTLILCFVCIIGYIFINDANWKMDSAFRDVQVNTYRAYSAWHRYIGTLKGLTLTNEGFGTSLDTARDLQRDTERLLIELSKKSETMNPDIAQTIEAFSASIQASITLGQELIENGYLLLAQPDLPLIYSEGRIGLSSLSGKDVTEILGPLSSYQYYQLIRRLKGLNTLFDQLYSSRMDGILTKIENQSERLRRDFFLLRLIVLGITFTIIGVFVFQLYGLNRYLRRLAQRTGEELATTKSHLSEVEVFLESAQFQQSLFEMVAALSHELNTPLGNCVSASSFLEDKIATINQDLDKGTFSSDELRHSLKESMDGFSLIRGNLDRMKLQIDTFKRLSSVNQETQGALFLLSTFISREIPVIAARETPGIKCKTIWDQKADPDIRYTDLLVIMNQLFENCRAHSQASAITISFRIHESSLDISFSDNGKGVSPEDLKKIAEPFFTTARGKNHMGLGLSILTSFIVNKLSGSISFHQGNPGLRISIHIPLHKLS